MVKCFVMCGLPASGKSWQAKKLAEEYDAEIFSSDLLREEMFGDVNHQADNDTLFKELHKRIRECLVSEKNAVYDACNISYKRRMEFLKSLNKIPCEKIAILMATPYEVCLERNAQRKSKVPEHVIKRMYMSWNSPYWYEGWDDIQIVYSEGAEGSYGGVCDWVESVMDYNQHNSHHSLTLGKHCLKTFEYLNSLPVAFWELRTAALIHDCGKPFCATYINGKGEKTDGCHFYEHQHVGSYMSLFFRDIDNHLYVAQLVQWHMRAYLAWEHSEKAMQKDRKLLGETLFNDICLLHEADLAAH